MLENDLYVCEFSNNTLPICSLEPSIHYGFNISLLNILYANQISKFKNIDFVFQLFFLKSWASKFGNIFSYINLGKPQSVYHITYI